MNRKKLSALIISALLMAELLFSAALPVSSWAESETHYIAVASDRHNEPTAISEAMSGMPESVEYVCLDGDMTNFDRQPRPPRDENQTTETPAAEPVTEPDQSPPAGTQGGTGTADSAESAADSGENAGTPAESGPETGLTDRPKSAAKQLPYNTSDVLKEVQSVFPNLTKDDVSIIYASHDSNATDDAEIMKCADTSLLPSSDAADHPEISEGKSGLIHTGENDSYYIYGVSYQDMKNAEAGQAAAEEFRNWVSAVNPAKPVIVIGHVPIHKMRKDNKGGTYWNAALNYAATGAADTLETGLQIVRDVIYLHGHNHGQEPSHSSTEYYKSPGDMIHAEGDEEETPLYYTYITAGYLTASRTATLLAITDDNISFTKYTGTKDSNEPSVASALGTRRRVHYYTVDFNDATADQTILEGNTAVQPQEPSREGYTFDGWYTDEACTQKYDFSTSVNGDVKLYAKWSAAEKQEDAGKDNDPEQTTPEKKTPDGIAPAGNTPDASANAVTVKTSADTSGAEKSNDSAAIVRTGDESSLMLWCTLMLTAMMILTIMITVRVRGR